MILLVGLGNPGKEYENTRHNIGFKFIDYIAKNLNLNFKLNFKSEFSEYGNGDKKIIIIKPQTYMNDSGSAINEICNFYKIPTENIFVAFDDLDIKQGEFKIQKRKYPKIHNGVNDIINKMKNDNMTFIRIGSDGRDELQKLNISGHDYVLGKIDYNFSEVFKKIFKEINLFETNLILL